MNPVFRTVRELAEAVRSRRVSPVELTEAFLDRLETLGSRYNAVVTVTRQRALVEARRAEGEIAAGGWRGPLHGIPYGAKDLLATAGGIPTTWGAAPLRTQTFDSDATVIGRLEQAGAVLVAKLAMVELAGGMGYRQPNASFTGPGISPWGRDAWSGGSSSGSGSAVAAGLVPFAIGSETWGSILSPAANCGVSGLRPTYGRVSRHGAMALCWTLDKLGPLALNADDCGLVLDAIAGPDPHDPTAAARPFRYDGSEVVGRRFRFGVIRDVAATAEDPVREAFSRSLEVLRKIGTVEEVTLADLPYEAITRTILMAEAASAFEDMIESGAIAGLTAPEDRFTAYARDAILAKDYIKALRLRAFVVREADRVLSEFDALVAPGRPAVASALDREFRSAARGNVPDIMGAIGNAAGLPAIAVPNGVSEAGLPTSLQFMGRAWEENTVLAAARAWQGITDYHLHHPPEVSYLA
ncbi:MAG TPA: amidase [Candidatus Acidoferrum sp.]|jgi:aspartyl-tRNA(Asn)/glutamyl-tRNA(Gln) amidotransferase subunit A|nr:amidase [Candidatus Acidoferrum sp.]